VLSSVLGSLLLLANYARGLIEAFTFLLMMSTSLSLIYYFVTSMAEVKHSWRKARGWMLVALFGCAYSVFAAFGSGLEILKWNLLTMVTAVPLYFLLRRRSTGAPVTPSS
jgi:APA family basic amino acid/polyamine antiporter